MTYNQPYYAPPPQKNTIAIVAKRFGIAALLIGLANNIAGFIVINSFLNLSITVSQTDSIYRLLQFTNVVGWGIAITAIVLGHIGFSRSNRMNHNGRTASMIGFILGYSYAVINLVSSYIGDALISSYYL